MHAPILVLASASARRKALLEACHIPFRVMVSDVSEEVEPDAAARGTAYVVELLAARKAESARGGLGAGAGSPPGEAWILSADTIVEIDGLMLGKPATEEEAARMLQRLSGRTHRVWSGIALVPGLRAQADVTSVATAVTFRVLTSRDLAWYLSTREWEGAAGAYRIQERAGFLVESIQGSYSNVVGLPLEALYGMLVRHRYDFGGQGTVGVPHLPASRPSRGAVSTSNREGSEEEEGFGSS
jgi:septum formation protein